MSGILDRYLLRIVGGAWGAVLLFLLFISVLVDVLNNLTGYLGKADDQGMGLWALLANLCVYYLQLSPFFFVSVAPFVTVIAAMFAMGRLMASHELHPMLFAGRSMGRVLRPVLAVGLGSGLLMAACWQWVLPELMASVARTRSTLSGQETELQSVVLEDKQGIVRRLYVRRYQPQRRTMEAVHLLIEGSGPGDAVLVRAPLATWDAAQADWRLTEGRVVRGRIEEPRQWLGAGDLDPDKIWRAGKEDLDSEFLSYTDLMELRQLRPQRRDVALALHRHAAYPLANLVLLLLALPFTIHFERRHRITRVLGAILACGAYLLVDLTCQSLGHRDYLHPVVAAWLPAILFGSLGVAMFGAIRT